MGGVTGVDFQWNFDRQQHLGDLLRQRLANFLVGDFLVEAGLSEIGDDLRSRRGAEVGHDQRFFEFFEGVVVEFAPVEGADDTAGQARGRLGQPAGQPREPRFPLWFGFGFGFGLRFRLWLWLWLWSGRRFSGRLGFRLGFWFRLWLWRWRWR